MLETFFTYGYQYGGQVVFALSPIAAYLPQYWNYKRNLVLVSPSPSNQQGKVTIDSCCSTLDEPLPTHPTSSEKGGFSSLSMLILVIAHVLRLEYLYGRYHVMTVATVSSHRTQLRLQMLEKSLKIQGHSVGIGAKHAITPNDTSENHNYTHMPYDLVVQSLVMIAMQILLLIANIRARTPQNISRAYKKKKQSFSLNDLQRHRNITPDNSRDYDNRTKQRRKQNGGYDAKATSTPPSSNYEDDILPIISTSPSKNIYVETQNLEHSDSLQHSSSYTRVFTLLGIPASLFFCHFLFFHTHYFGLDILCTLSIVLESSLAVPTLYLNFQRRDTQGLSFWMVSGWVVGDILKFFYFSSSSSPVLFLWGCILAITMDTLVSIQMIFWYPSKEVMELKEYLHRKLKRLLTK